MSSWHCCMVVNAGEWPNQTRKKLDASSHKSLRRLFKIYWPMQVTNEEIRARAGLETISKQVTRRRWTWLGHVLRMDHYSYPQIALTWVPEGKRKRGRPRETWRRTIERELKENRLGTWAAAAPLWRSTFVLLFHIGCHVNRLLEWKPTIVAWLFARPLKPCPVDSIQSRFTTILVNLMPILSRFNANWSHYSLLFDTKL